MATLLSALTSLGLLVLEGSLYTNAPASNRYLVRGAPGEFGDYYRYQIGRQVYPALEHLDRGIRGDPKAVSSAFFGGVLDDPIEADAFTRGQHAGSMGPAVMLARRLDLGQRRSLIDVAGGSGAFSIALCQANSQLSATVIDFPNVIDVASRFIAEAGLSSRISCIGGDALEVEWPQADAVLMSYLLSAVGPNEGAQLVDRAVEGLPPGGVLVVHDFMLDEDRGGPTLAALWFLQYLAYRSECVSFTPSQIETLLSERGFVDIAHAPLIPEVTSVVTAHKPGRK
jgi:precorrin-6B methylase 2